MLNLLTSFIEIPLADAGSLSTGPSADNQATFELSRLPKPEWRIRKCFSAHRVKHASPLTIILSRSCSLDSIFYGTRLIANARLQRLYSLLYSTCIWDEYTATSRQWSREWSRRSGRLPLCPAGKGFTSQGEDLLGRLQSSRFSRQVHCITGRLFPST